MRERAIPEATVARLPLYLRSLVDMTERGMQTISSEGLAEAAGVNSAKVRKDLSYLGSYGTRGVGYDVEYLIYQISRELGLTQDWNCVIVGVGNLGRALANYRGFSERGFRVSALVDIDETKIGEPVDSMVVEDFADLERIVKEREISIGIVATTAGAVSLRKVDLSIELQILSFYEQRKSALETVRRGKRLTASASKSTRP